MRRPLPPSFLAPGAALLMLIGAALAAPLRAQTVEGVLTEPGGRPVGGAVVYLLDEAQRPRGGTVTDAAGRFRAAAPGPGSYRVRAEVVGYRSTTSAPLELAAAETRTLALQISAQPVTLEGITVEGRSRGCRARPESAAATARVWDEARKALHAVSLSQAGERLHFDVELSRREMDPEGGVLGEERRAAYGRTGNPFQSVPVEELAEHGYSRAFPDSVMYYAPDAWVLLSDTFLDGHCFQVREGDQQEPGLVGLEFRPVRRPSRPDIEGVLWLDRGSAELRSVEYRYVGLPRYVPAGRFGGRVEFERLPSGAWIVRRWRILMPVMAAVRPRVPTMTIPHGPSERSYTLHAIVEGGGEVTAVYDPEERRRREGTGEIAGTVMDGFTGGPLGGATVFLSGTSLSAVTDTAGRYRIAGVPAGSYVVSFLHPRTRSLGIVADPARAVLEPGGTERVDLAIPTRPMVLARYCAGEEGAEGMITGVVRDAGSGEPAPGARVEARWLVRDPRAATGALELDPDGVVRRRNRSPEAAAGTLSVEVGADHAGFFRICGPPPRGAITLTARAATGATGSLQVTNAEDGISAWEVRVQRP